MRDSRIAIAATMLTAPIRVDVGAEGNVALGTVSQELGVWGWVLLRVPVGVPLQRDSLKPIGRVADGSAATRTRRPFAHKANFPHFGRRVEFCFQLLGGEGTGRVGVGETASDASHGAAPATDGFGTLSK